MENRDRPTSIQSSYARPDVNTWALPNKVLTRIGRSTALCIAFSADEKLLAIGSMVGLWLYDITTMNPLSLLDTERGLVSAVAFSSDGTLLATGNWDGDIKIWNVNNRQYASTMIQVGGQHHEASQLAFSPDGQYLAASRVDYGAIYIWRVQSGKLVAELTVENAPEKGTRYLVPLVFSPDGSFLANATPENTVSVWNIEREKRIVCLTGHTAPVAEIVFSLCGNWIASGDKKGILHEWDINKCIRKKNSCFSVLSTYTNSHPKLIYSMNGMLYAAGRSGTTTTVWDAKSGSVLRHLKNEQRPYRIDFSPKGSRLVLVKTDNIQIWKIAEPGVRPRVIRGHTNACGSVKFSPNGNILAAAYWDNGVTLLDIEKLVPQVTLAEDHTCIMSSLDFSPCGNKLAVSSHDTIVRVWDIGVPDAPPTELIGHETQLHAVAFSPKGNLLVSSDSKGVLGVWDVKHDYELRMFTEETGCILSIAFSPDGRTLVSAHRERNAHIWDVDSGKPITELSLAFPQDTTKYKGDARRVQKFLNRLKKDRSVPKIVVFSPDGSLLAGGMEGEIWFWDARTYETVMVIFLPREYRKKFTLAFSPCGQYIAAGSWWRYGIEKVSICLYDVTTGENITAFWGHPTDVQDLAFSPDGKLLASGSFDGTILLWDMKPYFHHETS